MKYKRIVQTAAAFTALSVLLSTSAAAYVEKASPSPDPEEEAFSVLYTDGTSYREYLDSHRDEKFPSVDVMSEKITREGSLQSFELDIAESGMYCIGAEYTADSGNSSDTEFTLAIDGMVPFSSAERLRLCGMYKDKTPVQTDENGNEIRPLQTSADMKIYSDLKDPEGLSAAPLAFFFEKGKHTVSFDISKGGFTAESVTLHAPEEYPSYEEYVSSVDASCTAENTTDCLIRTEGENAAYRNDPVLYPTYERSDCDVSPSDPYHLVYNTIGGGSWKKPWQTIVWEMEVPHDGWYRIGIKARQNELRGFTSDRRIYIDGKVPCAEMSDVRFYYSTDFELTHITGSDGEELFFYLTAGEKHTISMEAVPGAAAEYAGRLQDTAAELGEIYRRIAMVTGTQLDRYTDYYVHEKLEGITDDISRIAGRLRDVQNGIESVSGSEGSEAAVLENAAVILEKCADDPVRIPDYLSEIKNAASSVSAWMRDFTQQPLELDYIELASGGAEFADTESGLWESIVYSVKRFFASFGDEDSLTADSTSDEGTEVWVQLGREQAQIISELAASDYKASTGRKVNIRLVSGGIVEAALADEGPDAALFIGGEVPVSLGSRRLLADISEFEDFSDAAEDFAESSFEPYTYRESIYGMPLSQSWAVMFYRKDILAGLGFTAPPETWDDLRKMLPELQRNYMTAGLVLPGMQNYTNAGGVSPALETGHTFASLLLQRGTGFYDSGCTKTLFDTENAFDAFEEWTDFYTKYRLPQQYDAFSRFRTGEIPLVIADYSFANQLDAAAPEISGLWGFTAIPGTERDDGSISHAVNPQWSGAVVFENDDEQIMRDAWEFVKWFSSEEIQSEYAARSEMLMGRMGRYTPARLSVLKKLGWTSAELCELEKTYSDVECVPVIPSSYAVTRNIMNAFRETVNSGENPRDTLIQYNNDINDEIGRKNRSMNN